MRVLPVALLVLGGVAIANVASASSSTPIACSSSTACFVVQNTSSGPAIHAQGTTGYALRGNSSTGGGMIGLSAAGSVLAPGVEGESTNQAGTGYEGATAGAFGLTGEIGPNATPPPSPPAYGVFAIGTVGVYGFTPSSGNSSAGPGTVTGVGVIGVDQANVAKDQNVGVIGESVYNGVGVLGASSGTPTFEEFGRNPVGVYAVANDSSYSDGTGLISESNDLPIYAENTHTGIQTQIAPYYNALEVYNSKDATFIDILDLNGNETLTGSLTTSKSTYVRAKGDDGSTRISYGERTTAPQMEDDGEAQLQNGTAYVRIDSALHHAIDGRTAYLVFITPEGDNKGLFVSQKTPAGFLVRESQGGRSTLPFAYRIVAKPHDDDGGRLALAPKEPELKAPRLVSSEHVTLPLSPIESLKRHLGPAGYARAVADYNKRKNAK